MNTQIKLGQLFSYVSENPQYSLTKVFSHFSKKWSLSRDSIRNIYYQNYSKILADDDFCYKFNIDKNNFKKSKPKFFTLDEEMNLINDINQKLEKGYSLRKACLELALGDVSLMVRYLNKYRSYKQMRKGETEKIKATKVSPPRKEKVSILNPNNEPKYPSRTDENLETQNKNRASEIDDKERDTQGKIITMPSADILSEKDIQSLFLGLVRLVKNNTIKEMNFSLNEKYKEKVAEVYALKHNLSLIKNQLEEEKRIANKLQVELNLLKNSKLQDYEKFMSKLGTSELEVKKNN